MSTKRYMDFLISRYDIDTEIPLSDTGSKIVSYTPKDEPGEVVTETITIANLTSEAAARIQKGTIERFFELARQAQKNTSTPRTYLRCQPNTDTDVLYRSEVLDGNISLLHSTQSVEWRDGSLQFLVTVKRRNYFEADERVELLFENGEPYYVDVHYDSTHNNVLKLKPENIEGDLPAPIYMHLIRGGGNTAGPQVEFWIGHNVFSDPAADPFHMMEGEDAWAAGDTSTTPTADADCSDGNYNLIEWEATVETALVGWDLSSELLDACKAGRFGALLRLQEPHGYSDLYLRLRIQTTTNVLWQSDLILAPSRHMFWLDNFNLPPLREIKKDADIDLGGLSLLLMGLRNQAGTHTLKLDYLQSTPISEQSGLNYFLSLASGVEEDESFIIDEMNHQYLRLGPVAGDHTAKSEFTKFGKGLHVLPGFEQNFYISSCFGDYDEGYVQLDQRYQVMGFYRPRRRSI